MPETAVLPEVETCAECGFDSRRWNLHDADSFLRELGYWWRAATADIDAGVLNTRPAEGVWSVLEYGMHSAFVTAVIRAGVEMILAEDGVELPEPPATEDAVGWPATALGREEVLTDLAREGEALAALVRRAPADAWRRRGRLGDTELGAEFLLLHAVHDAGHHMLDVGRGLAVLGAGMEPATGRVDRVNTSGGGVPKRAVAGADAGHRGLVGDHQASRRHHGRSFQALCLWSSEVIAELAAEGHPIGPGFAGENLTLSGLDWSALRPGTQLRIGTVLAEVSFPATPCQKQKPWFSDGDYSRMDHDQHPARARWYAWVREPGHIDTGDAVVVRPG